MIEMLPGKEKNYITKDLIVTLYVSNRKSISLQPWPRFITPKPNLITAILQ